MDGWRVFEGVLFVGLFTYFASRVANSVGKLRESKVATTSMSAEAHEMLFPALTVCTSFVDRGTMLPELQVQDVQPNINVEELVLGMHNGFSATESPSHNLNQDTRGEYLHIPGLRKPATWALPCLTIEPTEKYPVGYSGAVNLYLNLSKSNIVYIHAYAPGSSYLPNTEDSFGKVMTFTLCNRNDSNCFQDFVLEKTEWKLIDQPSLRCGENERGLSVEACIDEYIESQVGCSSKLQRTPKNLRTCTTDAEYMEWSRLGFNVSHASDGLTYKMTGCQGPCKRTEYKLRAVGGVTLAPSEFAQKDKRIFWIRILFANSRYHVKEQYLVYDQNSFIADVGGYLGLLLGHSLYSIGCSLKSHVNKVTAWF